MSSEAKIMAPKIKELLIQEIPNMYHTVFICSKKCTIIENGLDEFGIKTAVTDFHPWSQLDITM